MSTLGSIAVKLGLDPSQFRTGLTKARAELAAFKSSIDKAAERTEGFGKSLISGGLNAAKFAIQAASLASAAVTIAPHLIGAWHAIEGFGHAAGAAAPALVAFGAAAKLVQFAVIRLGPEILRSFNPILDMFGKAQDGAIKLAGQGLPQLSTGFAKVNAPAFTSYLNSMALSMNKVVASFLNWGKSTAGTIAIRNTLVGTSDAVSSLVPHINQLVISFGNMLGRIAEVSLHAGAGGLGKILDLLTAKFDKINAASVLVGFNKLGSDLKAMWGFMVKVHDAGEKLYGMFKQNRAAIGEVQDGIAILALATGPIGAIAAVASLLARHWGEIRAQVEPFIGPFVAALSALLAQLAPLVPVVAQLAGSFLRELTPALQLLTPLLHVVVSLITFLAPVLVPLAPVILGIVVALRAWTVVQGVLNVLLLANPIGIVIVAIVALVAAVIYCWQHFQGFRDVAMGVWDAVKQIVLGALSIIIGAVKFWIDLFTGNWHGLWEDIKLILLGALNVVVGLFFNLPGRILGALGNLNGLLVSVGWDIVKGLWNGLAAGWDWLTGKVSSLAKSLLAAAEHALGIKSPSKLFADHVGRNIALGWAKGILGSQGVVESAMGKLAEVGVSPGPIAIPAPRGVAGVASAAAGGERPVVEFKGTDPILRLIRQLVRDNGGTADLAFARSR